MSRYVAEGSERQINVPSTCQRAVIAAAQQPNVESNIFDDARTEIYNLMKRDTLPRFVCAPRFDELLAALGEPTDIPSCDVPATLEAAKAALTASGIKDVNQTYNANYASTG